MPEIRKNSTLNEKIQNNFLKNFSKMHKLWNLEVWSWSFNKVSVSKVGLDYI